MTANLSLRCACVRVCLSGVSLCRTVAEGDSVPMKPCSRSVCQALALHQRQQGGDRKRKRHESVMGGWRWEGACVKRHMAYVRDRCFCAEGRREHTHTVASAVAMPPWGEQTDAWRGCTGMLGSQNSYKPSLMIFSLLLSSHHQHHLLLISSSQRTFTIPPELLIQ